MNYVGKLKFLLPTKVFIVKSICN